MAKQRRSAQSRSKGGGSGWKGSLKFSLISIPVRVLPATQHSDVSFHQLHRKCKTRIQMKKWCPHCEEEVSNDEIVKGYEKTKGKYVVAEESEIDELRPKASRTIDISHVLTDAAIDPVYIERAYFVLPENHAAGSPYAVVREGLGEQAAVGRMAMYGREYLVAIVPRENVLMLFTLRTAGEVRNASSLEGLEHAKAKTATAEVKLARQVLASFPAEDDLSVFTDNYQAALREMLESKSEAEAGEAPASTAKQKKDNVVPLMEALRRSLESARTARSGGRAKPASARGTRKNTRVLKHASRARRAS